MQERICNFPHRVKPSEVSESETVSRIAKKFRTLFRGSWQLGATWWGLPPGTIRPSYRIIFGAPTKKFTLISRKFTIMFTKNQLDSRKHSSKSNRTRSNLVSRKKSPIQEQNSVKLQRHSVEISGIFCHSDFTWNQFKGL